MMMSAQSPTSPHLRRRRPLQGARMIQWQDTLTKPLLASPRETEPLLPNNRCRHHDFVYKGFDLQSRQTKLLQDRHTMSKKRRTTEDEVRFQNTADAKISYNSGRAGSTPEPDSFFAQVSEYVSKLTNDIRKWFKSFNSRTPSRIPIEPTILTQQAIDVLEAKKRTPFDDSNSEHEAMLKELWKLLQPNIPFERETKNWERIGFQGKNPASDFRGQGMLGLLNLLYYCRHYTQEACDMLCRPHNGFPLSIAAINVSAKLTEILQKYPGDVGNRLFSGATSSFDMEERFNELFALVFSNFESFYSDSITSYLDAGGNPDFTIMQYNPIQKEYFESLVKSIGCGDFETKYASTALRRRTSRE